MLTAHHVDEIACTDDMKRFHSLLQIAIGAAYGTSKAGIGIAGIGSFKPELVMKVRCIWA